MKLVNLTPHVINIITSEGTLTLPSAGLARVSETRADASPLGTSDGLVPVTTAQWGGLTGLPDPSDGVAYVVSALVADVAWAQGRDDVYSPGPLVRGPDGQPVGCRGLTGRRA